MSAETRKVAVALHDVEPATFERCALIRDWLSDLGIDRVTLLVIPARDLHPFDRRRPELGDWLIERRGAGDAIAQHGFRHEQLRRAPAQSQVMARWQGGRAAEFAALGEHETRPLLSTALGLGTSDGVKRLLSPWLVRGCAALAGPLLRVDLHPADFDHRRHVAALEDVLCRAEGRLAVTYDELAAAGAPGGPSSSTAGGRSQAPTGA